MCDLVLGLMAASAGVQAIGQIQQGNAQSAAMMYNAQVAANNQRLAEAKAEDAVKRGETESADYARKVAKLRGTQSAAMAANGIRVDTGTGLDVVTDTERTGRSDLARIDENARREAWDYRISGMNYAAESELNRMNAKSVRKAGHLGAAGTLLSGGAQAAKYWYEKS